MAEKELKSGFRILDEQLGAKHASTVRGLNRLIQLYEDWDRPEEVAKWRKRQATDAD